MIERNVLVLNSPHWSHTGFPVYDEPVINLRGPGGFTVNVCGCTDGERPLVPPRVVLTANRRPTIDEHPDDCLPIPVINWQEGDHSFDRTPAFVFGGGHSQDQQYGAAPPVRRRAPGLELDDAEYDELQREQKRRLGLGDPDALLRPAVMATVVNERRRELRANKR